MIQKIIKNNDKKLDNLMIMMQKISRFLDVKWVNCELFKMMNKLEQKWTKHGIKRSNKVDQWHGGKYHPH